MRVGSLVWTFCILLGLIFPFTHPASASDTFVFRANSALQAAALMGDGALHQLQLRGSPDLLLGDLAGSTVLAVAVEDTECLMMGIQPKVRLVAFGPSAIVATLVEFRNPVPIFVGNSRVIFQAHGVGSDGLEAADLDALITLDYEPCTGMGDATTPKRVLISPLGTIRPTGPVDFDVPLFPDFGQLEIITDDPAHSNIVVSLSGRPTTATTDCNIDLNPSDLDFGNVPLGETNSLTLQIRNNGQKPCTISAITKSGSSAFSVSGPTSDIELAAGGSVTLDVTFTPFVTGGDSGKLKIASSDPADPLQFVDLTGNGTVETEECSIHISPLALNFGSVEVGTNKTLEVTVTNTGGLACSNDFTTIVSSSAGFTTFPDVFVIPANTSVVVSVTFTPLDTSGARGTVEFDTLDINGANTNLTLVSLAATGVTAQCRLEVDPTDLDFGAVPIGNSATITLNVSNVGITNCTILEITGTNDVFTLSPSVVTPFDIPAGTTVGIDFSFLPVTNGTTNVTIHLVHDNPSNTVSIVASGFGVETIAGCSVVPSKASFDFGDVTVGKTNVIKTTIRNTGLSTCTIHSISLTGSNDLALISPPTPLDLAPNASLEVGIRYTPTVVGTTGGNLVILSTDEFMTTQILPVTGAGVFVRCALSVDASSLDFGSILISSNVTQTVTLMNTNDLNCIVNSISIVGGGGAFALDPSVTTTRFALLPMESLEIPVIFTALSQGTNTATLRIESEDSVTPVTVALLGEGLRCNLSVSPTSLSFGDVTLHGTNTLTLTIHNTGNLDCTVESLTVIGGRFFVVSPTAPFGVPAFGSVPIDVEYRPEHIQTVVIEGGKIRSTGSPVVP